MNPPAQTTDYDGFFRAAFARAGDPNFGPFDYERQLTTEPSPELLEGPTGIGQATPPITAAFRYIR